MSQPPIYIPPPMPVNNYNPPVYVNQNYQPMDFNTPFPHDSPEVYHPYVSGFKGNDEQRQQQQAGVNPYLR